MLQVRPVQQGAEPGALQPPADAQQQATRHPISALRHQVRTRAGNTGSSRLTQGLRGVQERRYSGDAFLDISFVDFHVVVSVIETSFRMDRDPRIIKEAGAESSGVEHVTIMVSCDCYRGWRRSCEQRALNT